MTNIVKFDWPIGWQRIWIRQGKEYIEQWDGKAFVCVEHKPETIINSPAKGYVVCLNCGDVI